MYLVLGLGLHFCLGLDSSLSWAETLDVAFMLVVFLFPFECFSLVILTARLEEEFVVGGGDTKHGMRAAPAPARACPPSCSTLPPCPSPMRRADAAQAWPHRAALTPLTGQPSPLDALRLAARTPDVPRCPGTRDRGHSREE